MIPCQNLRVKYEFKKLLKINGFSLIGDHQATWKSPNARLFYVFGLQSGSICSFRGGLAQLFFFKERVWCSKLSFCWLTGPSRPLSVPASNSAYTARTLSSSTKLFNPWKPCSGLHCGSSWGSSLFRGGFSVLFWPHSSLQPRRLSKVGGIF